MTCVSHSHAWGAGELALSPVCGTPGCVPSGVVTKHMDFSGLLCVCFLARRMGIRSTGLL